MQVVENFFKVLTINRPILYYRKLPPGISTVYSIFSLNLVNCVVSLCFNVKASARGLSPLELSISLRRLPWPEGSNKSKQKSGWQSAASMHALICECIHSVDLSLIVLSKNASKSRKTSFCLSR